jgi:O-antigen ligase
VISKTESILAWSFPLLVLGGFLGRGIFNILTALCLLLFIVSLFRADADIRHRLLEQNILKGWAVFLATVLLANLFAVDIFPAMKKYAVFSIYSMLILAIGLWLYRVSPQKRENLEKGMDSTVFSLFFIVSVMLFSAASGYDLIRYFGKGETISYLGNYQFRFSIAVSLFFIPLYHLMKRKNFVWAVILLFMELFSIFYSQSRTALVAFAFSLLAAICLYFPARQRMKVLIFTILFSMAGGAALYRFSPSVQLRLKTFSTLLSPKGDRMSGRYDLYQAAMEKIEKRPLTGYGVKSGITHPITYKWGKIDAESKHPHNVVLEIFLDAGILGMAGLLYFVWIMGKEIATREREKNAVLAATLSTVFLTSLSSWSIWSVNHITVMLVIISMLFGITASQDMSRSSG